ncbi:VOC family protein [Aureivirga sp. CE67]|uniref:VOC family protein n=1 Tax=Aureivirga sp. CE67 TaxID=1788983 RepID=UPI0018C9324C|nr:VOC family protein [Aureivirga sp. CE67]
MNIETLKIYTENIEEQKEFYSETLGFNLIKESKDSLSYEIGKSVLILEKRENASPHHYAINIPAHKEEEALAWLKERVSIIKHEEHEIQTFKNWNAKAIYFYDKDKNIVEFIARRNLKNETQNPFSTKQLLEISEIGVATSDIERDYNYLHADIPLEIYYGSFEEFCAAGDEHGLFIFKNKNEGSWFPTHDKAISSDFEISFIQNNNNFTLLYEDEKFKMQKIL